MEHAILFIRGHKALLDSNLASLYGVSTKSLNQAVKRNKERFPKDFMFQLTRNEAEQVRPDVVILDSRKALGARSQFVTLKRGKNIKYLPYAFTEQGVAMLSSVLRSKQAVRVNIEIMRAFVRLRRILNEHKELSRRLDELEKKYDGQFKAVFDAIRQLMSSRRQSQRRIGFRQNL